VSSTISGMPFSNETWHKNAQLRIALLNFCRLSSGYVFIIFDRFIHQFGVILFYRTSSLLRHRLSQVARPLSNSGVTYGEPTSGGSVVSGLRSADLPMALSSPALGWQTFFSSGIIFGGFLRLRRRLRQVARPSSGSIIVFVRSLDLPPAPSSPLSGR
jgi:hypothetical protein